MIFLPLDFGDEVTKMTMTKAPRLSLMELLSQIPSRRCGVPTYFTNFSQQPHFLHEAKRGLETRNDLYLEPRSV